MLDLAEDPFVSFLSKVLSEVFTNTKVQKHGYVSCHDSGVLTSVEINR